MPDKLPQCDSPRHYVSAGSARHFLRQIWRELQDWTVTAFNSVQMTATAAMNILLLSVTAIFASIAVVLLLVRDQVMDKSPAPAVTNPAKLHTLTDASERTDRLAASFAASSDRANGSKF
jgi:hypothetical protein